VAGGETAGLRDGGWLGGDGDFAGLVDGLEDTEGEGEEAARGGEFAVGGCDCDVAGGPADAADLVVEEDAGAELFGSGGEIIGELGVAVGEMPGAIGFGGVFGALLDAEGSGADAMGVGGVEAFDVGGEGGAEVGGDVAGG